MEEAITDDSCTAARVIEELCDVCSKWKRIGRQFHIPIGILDSFQNENEDEDRLTKVVDWLERHVRLDWEEICCVLETKSVGEPNLAAHIRQKYCNVLPPETAAHHVQLMYHHKNVHYYTRCVPGSWRYWMGMLFLLVFVGSSVYEGTCCSRNLDFGDHITLQKIRKEAGNIEMAFIAMTNELIWALNESSTTVGDIVRTLRGLRVYSDFELPKFLQERLPQENLNNVQTIKELFSILEGIDPPLWDMHNYHLLEALATVHLCNGNYTSCDGNHSFILEDVLQTYTNKLEEFENRTSFCLYSYLRKNNHFKPSTHSELVDIELDRPCKNYSIRESEWTRTQFFKGLLGIREYAVFYFGETDGSVHQWWIVPKSVVQPLREEVSNIKSFCKKYGITAITINDSNILKQTKTNEAHSDLILYGPMKRPETTAVALLPLVLHFNAPDKYGNAAFVILSGTSADSSSGSITYQSYPLKNGIRTTSSDNIPPMHCSTCDHGVPTEHCFHGEGVCIHLSDRNVYVTEFQNNSLVVNAYPLADGCTPRFLQSIHTTKFLIVYHESCYQPISRSGSTLAFQDLTCGGGRGGIPLEIGTFYEPSLFLVELDGYHVTSTDHSFVSDSMDITPVDCIEPLSLHPIFAEDQFILKCRTNDGDKAYFLHHHKFGVEPVDVPMLSLPPDAVLMSSPDGRTLAIVSNTTLKVYNVENLAQYPAVKDFGVVITFCTYLNSDFIIVFLDGSSQVLVHVRTLLNSAGQNGLTTLPYTSSRSAIHKLITTEIYATSNQTGSVYNIQLFNISNGQPLEPVSNLISDPLDVFFMPGTSLPSPVSQPPTPLTLDATPCPSSTSLPTARTRKLLEVVYVFVSTVLSILITVMLMSTVAVTLLALCILDTHKEKTSQVKGHRPHYTESKAFQHHPKVLKRETHLTSSK